MDVPNDAVGRTPAVTGTMTIEGSQVTSVEITADLTQLASDEPRRDNAIRTNGLESERYPDAVFTLTEPVDLGTPVAGEVLETTAAGELTLREQVKPVTLNLEARWTGEQIEVAGDAPVRLSDFGIDAPVLGPVVSIEDEATVELQVVFVR